MFDVTDKRAVDRLAAVVVMLERREATARMAHSEVMRRFYASERAQLAWNADNMDEIGLERLTARAAWLEARAALAAARELATDR